jgi:hypothetical protein
MEFILRNTSCQHGAGSAEFCECGGGRGRFCCAHEIEARSADRASASVNRLLFQPARPPRDLAREPERLTSAVTCSGSESPRTRSPVIRSRRSPDACRPGTGLRDRRLLSQRRLQRGQGLRQLRSRSDAELWIHAVQVRADRAVRQEQPICDLTVRKSGRGHVRDLELLGR